MIDRQPPFDLQAEMGVLGSLCVMPAGLARKLIPEILAKINAEDFYDEGHSKIFAAMKAMGTNGKPIDPTLLVDRLKSSGDFEAVGGRDYISKVCNAVPSAAHATYYADIVADKAFARRVILEATNVLRDAYDETIPAGDLATRVEAATNRITSNRSGLELPTSISESVGKLIADLRKPRANGSGRAYFGIPTVDDRFGSVQAGEVCVVGGRASSGKTSFVTGALRHAAKHGRPSLLISLEMIDKEIANREATRGTGIDNRDIRSGQLDDSDYDRMGAFQQKLDGLPFYTWAPSTATLADIRSYVIHAQNKLGIGVLGVDYIGLIAEPPRFFGNRREHIAQCSRGMKRLAKELDLPLFLLCQLNREKDRPNLTMLRECGAIEEDADSVLLIHRDEADDTKRELIVAKFRAGATGSMWLGFDGERFEFKDLDNNWPPSGR